MRTANLDDIGIEVPLKPNEFYYNDGCVESVEEHRKKVCSLYGANYHGLEKEGRVVGLCQVIKKWNSPKHRLEKHIRIYYENFGNDDFIFYTGVHEQVHALDFLGRMDLLAKKIEEEFGIKINFSQIENREVKAHIGAIYFFLKETDDPNRLPVKKHGVEDYVEALYIWKNSKLPEYKESCPWKKIK
jgi:hypothetical protein